MNPSSRNEDSVQELQIWVEQLRTHIVAMTANAQETHDSISKTIRNLGEMQDAILELKPEHFIQVQHQLVEYLGLLINELARLVIQASLPSTPPKYGPREAMHPHRNPMVPQMAKYAIVPKGTNWREELAARKVQWTKRNLDKVHSDIEDFVYLEALNGTKPSTLARKFGVGTTEFNSVYGDVWAAGHAEMQRTRLSCK